MAPLTWRNVNAPDFSSSAQILGQAGRGLSSGSDSISGAFKDARERQINTRSNEGIGQLAGATNESDVERIMAQVLGSVSARDRNGALNNAIMGSSGRAIGLEGGRADIRNTENMISNRNATSARADAAAGRAATLAERQADKYLRETAAEDRLIAAGDADQAFAQAIARENPAVAKEVLPGSPGSLRQEVPPSVTAPVTAASSTQVSPQTLENPTQDGLPNAGVTGAIDLDGGAGEDTIQGGGSNTTAMDKALQSIMDGAPVTPEILATIQEGFSEDTSGPVVGSQSPDQIQAQDGALASVSSTIPSVAQVDGEVIAGSVVQAKIDEVIEANTDTETGQPTSPEATEQMGRSIYELMLETGVELTPEEVYEHIANRQASINAGETKKQKAYTAEVDANIYAEMNKLGGKGGEKLRQLILNNPDLPARDRDAYLKSLERFTSEEGKYKSRLTSTGEEFVGSVEERAARANDAAIVNDQVTLADTFNFAGQSLKSLGGEGDLTSAVAAVVASGNDGDLEIENVRSLLQKYHDDTNLPYSFIASQLDASLTGKWFNTKLGIDRGILDSRLGSFLNEKTGKVDASKITQIRSSARVVESIKADRALAQSEIDSLNTEYRILLDRPKSPEIDALIQELKVKHGKSVAVLDKAKERADDLFNNDKDDNTVMLTPEEKAAKAEAIRDAAIAAASDTQNNIPANTPTPRGWEVDPNQSNVRQAINQQFGTKDVENSLTRIIGKLGGEGAYPGNEFFGSIFDNFQSQESAASDRDNRAEKREVSDWYKSKEAQELFYNNPILTEEAEKDPTAFYKERMKNR